MTSALVRMGISLLGSLLINALIPPVEPEETKPNYALSGWRDRLDSDDSVPVVLRQTRYAPPFAARSYTEIVGYRQYVRALFVFGGGPLWLSDFPIGAASIAVYDEAEIEMHEALPDEEPVTLYPCRVLEAHMGVDLIKPLQRDDQGDVSGERSVSGQTRNVLAGMNGNGLPLIS